MELTLTKMLAPSSMGMLGLLYALTVVERPPAVLLRSKRVMLIGTEASAANLERWYAAEAPPAPAPVRDQRLFYLSSMKCILPMIATFKGWISSLMSPSPSKAACSFSCPFAHVKAPTAAHTIVESLIVVDIVRTATAGTKILCYMVNSGVDNSKLPQACIA